MALIRTNTNSQFSTSFLDHSQPSSPMAASFRSKNRVFKTKDEVEVCSKEQGFVGSYYAASVVANMGNNYVVEYKNLVEEGDDGTNLRETVKAEEVRPQPPRTQTAKKMTRSFGLGEVVDAFDNDGWWVGVVTGKRGIFCTVFFETSLDHIAYPATRLRPHLEWRGHKWSYCKNRASFIEQKYFISKGVSKSILDEKMEQLRQITQSKVQEEEEEDGDGESSVNCKKRAHEGSSEVEPCIVKKPRLS